MNQIVFDPQAAYIQELRDEIEGLQVRLAALRTVYDQFKYLDRILSDPVWTQDEWKDDTELGLHHVLYDCWKAIKQAVEGEHG